MEFAVVWKTYQSDVEMQVDITFQALETELVVTPNAAFLTMISNAENIEDVDDPGLRVFMNSFKVASDLEDFGGEDAEAYIEYTFSGGIDYEYVIKFEYGAPGGENVFMIDPPPSPDGDDDEEDDDIASASTEGFFGQRTQSIIYITVGIVALVALVYFFLL